MNFEFFGKIFENYSNTEFMKMCPVAAELFHTITRTDRHNEANIRFSKFREAPNK